MTSRFSPYRFVKVETPQQIAPESFAFTVLLGVLAALPAMSIDISTPTLVLLPAALRTSPTIAGLSISLFMVGFALGQFGGGTISDRRGRRPVLLTGLGCFVLAGLASALARSGPGLALFRLIQGCGAGTCSVISFAMVQDLFEGHAARVKRSYVTVVFAAVPIIAPTLGVIMTSYAGWRSVHAALAIVGLLVLAVVWPGIAESRWARNGRAPGADRPAARLRDDPRFVGIVLANALSYAAVFAFVAGSPVVIIGQMGFSSATFAAVFAGATSALTLGALINGRLSRRGVEAGRVISVSVTVAAVAGCAVSAAALSGVTEAAVLLPLLLVMLLTRGFIAPNMQHLAIDRQRHRPGVASAVVGVSQLLSGALSSAVVAALLPMLGPAGMAVPMALFAACALLTWGLLGLYAND